MLAPVSPSLRPDLKLLIPALRSEVRWSILGALSRGEALMVIEIAERVRAPATTVSKSLAVFRRAGIVQVARNGLYQIPAHFRPQPGEPIVDFGSCLLRFDPPT